MGSFLDHTGFVGSVLVVGSIDRDERPVHQIEEAAGETEDE